MDNKELEDEWQPFANVRDVIGYNKQFEVRLEDGTETFALYDDNYYRIALLIRRADGLYCRNMNNPPAFYRKIEECEKSL